MCTLLLRLFSLRLSSKAVFDELADSLFMTIVGVVAIVDATICHRTLRRARRPLVVCEPRKLSPSCRDTFSLHSQQNVHIKVTISGPPRRIQVSESRTEVPGPPMI